MMELSNVAIVLLASGLSSRFSGGDKLLAPLGNKSILEHIARPWGQLGAKTKVAVIGADETNERAETVSSHGWDVLTNHSPQDGIGSSISLAVHQLIQTDVKAVICILGDMPFVPADHASAMIKAANNGYEAVITRSSSYQGPPALFHRSLFSKLTALSGDNGARSVIASIKSTAVSLSPKMVMDIDTVSDLKAASN